MSCNEAPSGMRWSKSSTICLLSISGVCTPTSIFSSAVLLIQSPESYSLTLKDAEIFFADAVSIFWKAHNRITTLSQDEEAFCILFLWNLNVDHLKPLPEH